MITLAWYFLKVIICSGILCGYYFLALRNKAFHRWNRFYLLASIVISLLAPIVKINIFQSEENKGTVVQMLQTISYGDDAVIEYSRNNGFQLNTQTLAESAYLLISAIFLLIFFVSLYKIIRLKKKYPETKIENISFINTDAKGTPFSFFKSIFWNNAIDLHSKPGQQIFNHEIAHIKEKHSYDKIFMNIVLIFFWINPFFWLMRKELNMIHEFIADKEALEDNDINDFAEMVLQTVYPGQNFSITNNFFYSPLKRRIMMLSKNKNPKVSYVSRLLVLPLATIVFFAFTIKIKNENNATKNSKTEQNSDAKIKSVTNDIIQDTIPFAIYYKGKKLKSTKYFEHSTKVEATYSDGSKETITKAEALKRGFIPPPPPPSHNVRMYHNKLVRSVEGVSSKKVVVHYKDGTKETITNEEAKKADFILFTPPKIVKDTVPAPSINLNSSISSNVLYVLDGKIISKKEISAIEPKDIKSITILKDTSSLLKYGEKGKNGVIEITTKKIGEEIKDTQTNLHELQKDSIPRIVFTKVETEASFPGGPIAWQKYIVKKIQASLDSFTEADFGTCLVKFIVNTDGSVSKVEATTMKGTHLAKISVNAIKDGPKWIPASQNGHTVASYRLQPVTLTNPDQKKSSAESEHPVNFTPLTTEKVNKNILLKLQQPASFPGGQTAWLKYISRVINKHGNELVSNKNNFGTCKVQFIVDKNGKVSDVKATTMQGTELAEVAVNAIKKGPYWIPAKQDGQSVNSYVMQPIGFALGDQSLEIKGK